MKLTKKFVRSFSNLAWLLDEDFSWLRWKILLKKLKKFPKPKFGLSPWCLVKWIFLRIYLVKIFINRFSLEFIWFKSKFSKDLNWIILFSKMALELGVDVVDFSLSEFSSAMMKLWTIFRKFLEFFSLLFIVKSQNNHTTNKSFQLRPFLLLDWVLLGIFSFWLSLSNFESENVDDNDELASRYLTIRESFRNSLSLEIRFFFYEFMKD